MLISRDCPLLLEVFFFDDHLIFLRHSYDIFYDISYDIIAFCLSLDGRFEGEGDGGDGASLQVYPLSFRLQS